MKTIEEKIAVMQAFADGKKNEAFEYASVNLDWFEIEPHWNWVDYDYRIKSEPPKPKIVPYESAEEFLAAMKEHGPYILCNMNEYAENWEYKMPLDVMSNSAFFLPDSYDEEFNCVHYDEFLNAKYRWQDGTPCGKEVTE